MDGVPAGLYRQKVKWQRPGKLDRMPAKVDVFMGHNVYYTTAFAIKYHSFALIIIVWDQMSQYSTTMRTLP